MTNIKAKKVILKNRDGEHLIPITDVDALNYKNITNCLLEVPQRIKYNLADGVLTIKAGSVVIVPYGVEDLTGTYPVGSTFLNDNFKVADTQFADGKFFVWAEVQNDTTRGISGNTTCFLQLGMNDGTFSWYTVASATSGGSTAPTGSALWFDTTNNYAKGYNSGSLNQYTSLPMGIFTLTDGYITSFKHFNGLGYIGSTVWVDKGVKGLIPNGRNEDGTLKNIEFTTDKILTAAYSATMNGYATIRFTDNQYTVNYDAMTYWSYNQEENLFKGKNGDSYFGCYIAKITTSNGVITEWNSKQPITVADIQDVVRKSGDTMTGKLSFDGVPESGHIIMHTNRSDIINVRTNHLDFDFTTTTAPSTNKYLQRFLAYDKNKNNVSAIETVHSTSNNIYTQLIAKRSVGDAVKSGALSVGVNKDGEPYTSAPHCSNNGGIVTQAGLSKSTNGYMKFGNGLILQWGVYSSGSGGDEYTITLPTAFSNTNYSVVGVSRGDKVSNSDYQVHFKITSKTQFKKTGQVATGIYWFAIGY